MKIKQKFKNSILILLLIIFNTITLFACNSENNNTKNQNNLEVHFLDVGQADCSLIKFPDGSNMLIDAGNNNDSEYIKYYLETEGIKKIDIIVGTHPHEDHIGSLDTIINNFEVKKIYLPDDYATTKTFEDVLDAIANKGLKITTPNIGEKFNLGGAEFIVLAPQQKYDDHNNNSIVLKMNYNENSFMFTGDCELKSEKDILNKNYDLKSDVLKVAHHGSTTSTSDEWLEAVSPKYAVIQSETGNDYGHPHKEIIEKLEKSNIDIYRNDIMGEIIFLSDGKNLSVTTSNKIYPEANDKHNNIVDNTQIDNTQVDNAQVDNTQVDNTQVDNTQIDNTQVNNTQIDNTQVDNTQVDNAQVDNAQVDNAQVDNTQIKYIGNKNSKKFHKLKCSSLPNEENRIYFNDRNDIITQGYEPCGKCKP